MKLPNREQAYIPRSKLEDYLLSETHAVGRSKAQLGEKMFRELDLVVLARDIKDHGLEAGDVGTVVHCYTDKAGFEVEFVTAEGKTIGVLTLTTADIRPFQNAEILHSRDVAPVAA